MRDVVATLRLIRRCLAISEAQEQFDEPGRDSLVGVGLPHDIDLALSETSSELLQVSGVCEAVEAYPDLDPGKAVVRQGQILDSAFMREGQLPIFITLSEADQLRMGNALLKALGNACNPADPRLGRSQVISLIDAEAGLSEHLGLDVPALCKSVLPSTPHKLLRAKAVAG